MTTISKDANLITFINVFTVDPANQSRLVELLIKATDASVRHARGFVSSSSSPKPGRHQGHDVRAVAKPGGLRGNAQGTWSTSLFSGGAHDR